VRTELEGAGATPEPQAIFSRDGTLIYAQGEVPRKSTRPVWVDRQGKVQPLGMPPRAYRTARLSPDGKELFYRNGPKLMSVAVNLSPEFTAAPPRLLFEGPYTTIDVSPDGRFLALEPVEAQIAPLTHLNIVLNWFEDVRRKAGTHADDRR
jgi:hypothetical protein